jgi:hypothetical protein
MKHSPKSQAEDKAKYHRKRIIRIVIMIILYYVVCSHQTVMSGLKNRV